MNNTGTKYVRIMKQTASWREKNEQYVPCLKYSVPIFVELNIQNATFIADQTDQPKARGEHVACDKVLCCPQRNLKWEKNLTLFLAKPT